MTLIQLAFCFVLFGVATLRAAEPARSGALAWDRLTQSYQAKRGETNLTFAFQFANTSTNDVVVHALRASCDCTTPSMPFSLPGTVGPGGSGQMRVDVDIRDRHAPFNQTIRIETSAGTDRVTLQIKTPELTGREKDQLAAFADRQAIFKGECATCHWRPALGKSGDAQFKVLCGTCHESAQRAEMVPDLNAVQTPKDNAYWEKWIRKGKPGTLMPAFAKPWGGPLNEEEVGALIRWLMNRDTLKPAATVQGVP